MECGAVVKVRECTQRTGFVDIAEGHDMRREIARTFDGGLLGVASRDRSDAGFADFGLERNFAAARLQPVVQLLEAASGFGRGIADALSIHPAIAWTIAAVS